MADNNMKSQTHSGSVYRGGKFITIIIQFCLVASGLVALPGEAALISDFGEPVIGAEGDFFSIDPANDLRVDEQLQQLEESMNDMETTRSDAIELSRQGLISIKNGDKEGGLKLLQRAWATDKGLGEVGVIIAISHLENKHYAEALTAAQQLQTSHPYQVWGYSLAGIAYGGLEQPDLSKAAFIKALEIQPGDPEASLNLAVYAINEGHIEQARTLYEDALARHPNHENIRLSLIVLEDRDGNTERATALLQDMVVANPHASSPRIYLARYQIHNGNAAEALAAIEPLKAKNADSADFMEVQGRAELMSGNVAASVAVLKKWTQKSNDDPKAHFYLSAAYETQGEIPKAYSELAIALELDPQNGAAKLAKARLLLKTSELSKARDLLSELASENPENPAVAELQGRLAQIENKPLEAVKYFEIAYRNRENNYMAIQLAAAQWIAGETEQGDSTLISWLEKYPQDLLTRFVLADAMLSRGDLNAAKKTYEEILAQSPHNARAQNNIAWILLRENKAQEALPYARGANRYTGNPEYMDTLAMILLQLGKIEEAMPLLRQAAQQAPDNPEIQFHLANALNDTGQHSAAKEILAKILTDEKPFPQRQTAQTLFESLK